ncbi:unnamed protein product [Effrenium voratum]|nr:unnamed protein product [Effrenium voratum]
MIGPEKRRGANLWAVVWENALPGPAFERSWARQNWTVVDPSFDHAACAEWCLNKDFPLYGLTISVQGPQGVEKLPFLCLGDVVRVHRARVGAKPPRYINIRQQTHSSVLAFPCPDQVLAEADSSEVTSCPIQGETHTVVAADKSHPFGMRRPAAFGALAVLAALHASSRMRAWGQLTMEQRRQVNGGPQHLGEFLFEVAQLTPCRYVVNGLSILETTADLRGGRAQLAIDEAKGRQVLTLRSLDGAFAVRLDASAISGIELEDFERTGRAEIRLVDSQGRRHLSILMLGEEVEARFQIMQGRWTSRVQLKAWIQQRLQKETASKYLVPVSELQQLQIGSKRDVVVKVLALEPNRLMASDGSVPVPVSAVSKPRLAATWLASQVKVGHWLRLQQAQVADPAEADLSASAATVTRMPEWCLDVQLRRRQMDSQKAQDTVLETRETAEPPAPERPAAPSPRPGNTKRAAKGAQRGSGDTELDEEEETPPNMLREAMPAAAAVAAPLAPPRTQLRTVYADTVKATRLEEMAAASARGRHHILPDSGLYCLAYLMPPDAGPLSDFNLAGRMAPRRFTVNAKPAEARSDVLSKDSGAAVLADRVAQLRQKLEGEELEVLEEQARKYEQAVGELNKASGPNVTVLRNRAHFYVYCSKVGTLWSFTDYWPFVDYEAEETWRLEQYRDSLNLQKFQYGHHDALILDNLVESFSIILKHRALLQSNADVHILGESMTGVYAYRVFLWAIPVCITDVQRAPFDSSEWLQANVLLDALPIGAKCFSAGQRQQIRMSDMP